MLIYGLWYLLLLNPNKGSSIIHVKINKTGNFPARFARRKFFPFNPSLPPGALANIRIHPPGRRSSSSWQLGAHPRMAWIGQKSLFVWKKWMPTYAVLFCLLCILSALVRVMARHTLISCPPPLSAALLKSNCVQMWFSFHSISKKKKKNCTLFINSIVAKLSINRVFKA